MRFVLLPLLLASIATAQSELAPLSAIADSISAGEAPWTEATRSRLLSLASGAPRREMLGAWRLALDQDAGRPEEASTIERGLIEGGLSPRLAGAALQRVLAGDTADAVVERFVAQLELIDPASDASAPLRDRLERQRRIVALLDPVPATADNERLVVHVARLGYALRSYGETASLSGLDARGELYVRFGEPDRIRSVSFDDGEILRVARNRGIHISRSDYPDNEVWIYDRLSDQGVYIFVKGRDRRYVLGRANSLIPRGLRARGGNRGPRAAGYTEVGLMTLRHVLGQLALFHPSYSSRYAEVQNYVSYIEEATRAERRRSAGGARMPDFVSFDQDGARGFIDALARNDVSDEGIAAARQETMPAQASPAVSNPLDVRLVRFLDGGETVRELLWSSPDGGRSTVWRVTPSREPLADTLASGVIRIDADVAAGGQIGVQIDRWVGDADAGIWRPELAGYVDAGADLRANAEIELSDALPFEVDDVADRGDSLRARIGRGEIRPLLSSSLAGREGIGVYMESYLANPRGPMQVRYKIITRRRGRLFRPSSSSEDEFQFIRPVNDEVTPIAFLVDRANWEGADEVDLEVEVEYLRTGAVARRVVSFTVD